MASADLAQPVHDRMQAAIRDLKSLLDQRVTTAEVVREHHSHGESYHPAALPDAVCFPDSIAEVSEIMKISAKHQVPVIPFGAGTSMEAQVNAIHGGITIDMREMNKVVRISRGGSAGDRRSGNTAEAICDRRWPIRALHFSSIRALMPPLAE